MRVKWAAQWENDHDVPSPSKSAIGNRKWPSSLFFPTENPLSLFKCSIPSGSNPLNWFSFNDKYSNESHTIKM